MNISKNSQSTKDFEKSSKFLEKQIYRENFNKVSRNFTVAGISKVLENYERISKVFQGSRKSKDFDKPEKISKVQNFRKISTKFSRLYNNENIQRVEVFSFLYKREKHWVSNGNTLGAKNKDLESLGSKVLESWQIFVFVKSNPKTRF